MKVNNPWSRQMIDAERAFFAESESEMAGAYLEARQAERYPKETCEKCQSDAWFHSGIGTYRCLNGHIRITRNLGDGWETFWN